MNIFVLIGYVIFGLFIYVVAIEIFGMVKTKDGWTRESNVKELNKMNEEVYEAYHQD